MYSLTKKCTCLLTGALLFSTCFTGAGVTQLALAQTTAQKPALIITSKPLPESLRKQLERGTLRIQKKNIAKAPKASLEQEVVSKTPAHIPTTNQSNSVAAKEYSPKRPYSTVASVVSVEDLIRKEPMETLVTKRVKELERDLNFLGDKVTILSKHLNEVQAENEVHSAEYFAALAAVNTSLQTGTTPGNPRLINKIDEAKETLGGLALSITNLSNVSLDASQAASEASFLISETREAYHVSGAVEEDHERLNVLEDAINGTVVVIERLLNRVNDDISRTNTYLASERNNLRTLELAVANGDLYGKSLANKPFSRASAGAYITNVNAAANMAPIQGSQPVPATLLEPRPLVKIRFDRTNVDYEQSTYMALNEALEQYPDAQFDLIAVHPTQGNAAELAIESTKARRNAEKVLRTLVQMGLPSERINLVNSSSDDARTSEVHIFVK